jgi:hypothetical protein
MGMRLADPQPMVVPACTMPRQWRTFASAMPPIMAVGSAEHDERI